MNLRTLYVKNDCAPCQLVKDHIAKYGIVIETVNVSDNKVALAQMKAQGMRTVPTLDMPFKMVSDSKEIIRILGNS
jgi:glutaredoxin